MTHPLPARILRPEAERCLTRPPPSPKDRENLAYLLESATNMLEKHGRAALELKDFAGSTGIGLRTIRRLVCDIHHLFGLVLTKYLDDLIATIAQRTAAYPDHHVRARDEYRRLTRSETNGLTRLHILYTRDRFALPPDELAPLERQRRILGTLLAGDAWQEALDLLDSPFMPFEKAEAMIQAGAAFEAARLTAATPQPELPLAFRHAPACAPHLRAPHLRAPLLPTARQIHPVGPTFRNSPIFTFAEPMTDLDPMPPEPWPSLPLRQSLFRTATSVPPELRGARGPQTVPN